MNNNSMNIKSLLLLSMFYAPTTFAFENTDLLPKGVRRIQIKTANTTINEKTDGGGKSIEIADPLQKNVKFADIIKKENTLRQNQIRSTLSLYKFDENESVGQMHAQMQGNVTVVAPVFAYGITEKMNLAIGVPYYKANMDVQLGFTPTERAQAFLTAISNPNYNQVKAARDAGAKLNNAVSDLNEKLVDNGFSALEKWENSGIGDITLAAKNLHTTIGAVKFGTLSGVVLPTGKTDDPDNLIDIPFGDGTYDIFAMAIFDEDLTPTIKLNQFAKYTYQPEARKEVRLKTADESIEVEKDTVTYKLGDIFETGLSAQYTGDQGIEAGLGARYSRSMGDRYDIDQAEVAREFQKNTDKNATFGELMLGYSSIPAFKRKQIAVPYKTTLGYKKHLASRNTFTNDLVTFDVSLFF